MPGSLYQTVATDSDEGRFEDHLVSHLLANLSDAAILGAADYHVRGDRLDRVVEVRVGPAPQGGRVHYVLLTIGGERTVKAGRMTRQVADGLRVVVSDAVKATVEEIGSTTFPFDPAVERISQLVARSLPKARRTISEATIEKMVDALVETQDPIAQVSAAIDADNARARHRFMSEVKTLTAEDVAASFGSSARNRHQTASRWKVDRRIFSVPWQGRERYPAFQFKDGKPLPEIAVALAALPDRMSAWEVAFWFVSANGWLDGAAPHERLGDGERLAYAARLEGEAIAG